MSLTSLDCITVCVNYAKYLKLTIDNRRLFNRWLIVTAEHDQDTIKLCKEYDLQYHISERLYEDGPFCKGKAINDGILKLDPKEWVCIVDADIFLFIDALKIIFEQVDFKTDHLYGLYGRLLVKDEDELKVRLKNEANVVELNELDCIDLLVGFFQMWHRSMRKFYPEESKTAGLDDILMRNGYDESRRVALPSYCIHIGEPWINHGGSSPISVKDSTIVS